MFALVGARIYDGSHFVDGRAVVIEGGRIVEVALDDDLPSGVERRRVEGLLAPGFIDVQVNGGGGVLFNDVRTADGVRSIGEAHRVFGTTGYLPTFITDTRERMAEAIGAVREALADKVPGVLGIHLEGPFLNPERKGVHDASLMRPIEDADIEIMTSLRGGVTQVTLAPEMVPGDSIRRLSAAGVIVSAGHTKAGHATIRDACRNGLRGFTHLFNGMPPLAGRDPGPVGAALDGGDTWCGIIADGHHVDAGALRVAIAAKGVDRMMLVTDAMPSVGSDLTEFALLGTNVFRSRGRLTTAEGILAGSDLDMGSAVRNAVEWLGLALPVALRMASSVPATFLRLDHELGRVAAGFRASLVLLDDQLMIRKTWIDGREADYQAAPGDRSGTRAAL
jgi:N-acetylglucosamine-6-phosphate deacetylase